MRSHVQNWILAFRPKTLTAALVPVVVATALVKAEGREILWWISGFALASALFIQIATNILNDAIDYQKGADNHERIGPRRVTQSGLIGPKWVMAGGIVCLFIAAALGIPLLIHGGLPIFAIGLVSLFLGYAYTGGPFPLAYKGCGDVFVILFFGIVAVGGVYFLHTQSWNGRALIAGAQIGLLATVLLAVNNLRDMEGDAKVGKRTLAVRLGPGLARLEIAACAFLPFVLNLFWLGQKFSLAALLPCLSLPLAWIVVRNIYRFPPGPIYNKFLGQSALLHLGFGILLTIGLFST